MNFIDSFLNRITMYRLVLYFLMLLVVAAAILGAFGLVPYNPLAILGSALLLLVICWAANGIFAATFKSHTNVESAYITALILALIISPIQHMSDVWFYVVAGVLSVATKFIFAIGKKHIFNPAAIAVVITAFAFHWYATWWVGTKWLLPLVIIGGVLIVRKIQRNDLVLSFFGATLVTLLLFCMFQGSSISLYTQQILLNSPLFFFAFVMLTEPLTMPHTNRLQVFYGVLVGVLFVPQIHVGPIYTTPELALVVGNVFAYIVSPKQKLRLILQEKRKIAHDTYEFDFVSDKKFSFKPGQYLEWTLGHAKPDSRGNRRYFTIASAPAEPIIKLAVRFFEPASSFKRKLLTMQPGETIVAGGLSGDFTMPDDPQQKLVCIAGGIGITPFRSMVQDLIYRKESRDIIVLYVNRTAEDISYKQDFDAASVVGVRTLYALTSIDGRITEEYIRKEIPDFIERKFYISGPNAMVQAYERLLHEIGVPSSQIIVDYFPGF